MRGTTTPAILLTLLASFSLTASSAATVCVPTTVQGAAPADDQRESLQQYLRRVRASREAVLSQMKEEVDGLLQKIEEHYISRASSRRIDSERRKLTDLGAECAPLLVKGLEPQDPEKAEPTGASLKRAELVKEILIKLDAGSIGKQLLELAELGSPQARKNCFQVLAQFPVPDLVIPRLVEMYNGEDPELRFGALSALALLGGDEAARIYDGAMTDPDDGVVSLALMALTATGDPASASKVLTLVQSDRFKDHVEGVAEYYSAVPDALDESHIRALLGAISLLTVSETDKGRTLDMLASIELRATSDMKKALKPLIDHGSKDVRASGLVLATLWGDSSAKRELLKPYDDRVNKNSKWSQAYTSRAQVRMRIREYKLAIKDFKQSLKVQPGTVTVDYTRHIGIARCYVRMDDFRAASGWLEEAPASIARIRELARDPDFKEMAADSKYRKVFYLGEE